MARLKILTFPDPRLRKVASPVKEFDKSLIKITENMLETMYDAPGIGLAAVQVGVPLRVIVMDISWNKEDGIKEPKYFVNPVISNKAKDLSIYEEGCLSIPDHFAEITRPELVQVQWVDLDGKQHSQEFDGLKSTCIQHEIDHLNGKLFIYYLGPIKRQMITRKMQKFKREKLRGSE